MLRGLKWQLLLLTLAIILLGGAILLQPGQPEEAPPQPPTPTVTPAPAAALPTPLPPQAMDSPVVFREGVVGQVQRLNPLYADLNPVDRDITRLIFEGLVTTNAYGEYQPLLAAEWLIASNQLEYVFRLRQDVLWQDGLPFTAADVAATVALLQSTDSALPEDLVAFWRTVELEVLDEYTVRFRLAQPLAAFLDYLRVGILPAHVFGGLPGSLLPGHPFNLSPIGTGPYQLEAITGDDTGVTSVSLRAAPAFRQRPEGRGSYAMERLVFRMFRSQEDALAALRAGEIDGLGGVDATTVTDLEQAGIIHTHLSLAPILGVVLFNWESAHTAAFRDQRVRQALIAGTDRMGLVNRHLSGKAVAADSPLIPGSWAYRQVDAWPAYDPVVVRESLGAITFARPTPTPEPTLTPAAEETPEPTLTPTEPPPIYDFGLLCSDDPLHVAVMTDLASQWSQLGLDVRLEAVPLQEFYRRLEEGDFDVALVELSLSPRVDPDPYAFWHQGQYPDGQNYAGINDRRSSELLERARRDPNGIHRAEYYAEFQQVFASRTLAMPLYYPVYAYAVSARFEGIEIGYMSTPADRFFSLAGWRPVGR